MRRGRAARAASLLAGPALLLSMLLTVGALPAAAHTHPTQVELDQPAVVYVKTFAQVTFSLVEHNRHGKHIGLYQRTYEPELAAGSGFAVNPNGTVVTDGAVVTPDLKRAEVWAVNKAFNEHYHAAAPLPADPFTKHHIKDLPDDPLDQRLQRCYQPNTTDNTGGCLLSTTRVVRVYPWVTDQAKYGQLAAEVLSPAEGKTQDVAVLRVGANSMPTVALAASAASTKAFTVLGFTAVPTGQVNSELQPLGHFKAKGGLPLDKDEVKAKLLDALRAGASGGPLVAAESGQVAGFLSLPPGSSGSAEPTFVDVKRIRDVLAGAGVAAGRGPTDAVYEDAMHSFKNKLYTAPIASFQKALELYPGHALATAYLAESKQKQGGPEDLTGKGTQLGTSGVGRTTRGVAFWVVSGLVLLAVLAALAVLLILRRRSGRPPADSAAARPAAAAGPPPPGAAHATPAAAPKARPPDGPRPADGPRPPDGPAAAGPDKQPAAPVRPVTATRWRMPERHTSREADPAPPAAPSPPAAPAAPTPAADKAGGPGLALTPAAPMLVHGHAPAEASPAPEHTAGTQRAFCTQCGQRLATDHRFCGYCGAPVS